MSKYLPEFVRDLGSSQAEKSLLYLGISPNMRNADPPTNLGPIMKKVYIVLVII